MSQDVMLITKKQKSQLVDFMKSSCTQCFHESAVHAGKAKSCQLSNGSDPTNACILLSFSRCCTVNVTFGRSDQRHI